MSERKPLLFRLTPPPLRAWLRRIATPYLDRLGGEVVQHSPWIDGRHVPVQGAARRALVPMGRRTEPTSPDGLPVPPPGLWWNYATTAERYIEIGRQNIEHMRSVLRAAGRDLSPGDRVLDFGCAAGPQIRNLAALAREGRGTGGEVWGVDMSGPHISWCLEHLPTDLRFATTTTAPHLPFEDRYFDLVYAGSVFSHIGDMADAWMLELGRIVRPGGLMYLTVVTRESMRQYLEHWPDLEFSRMVRGAFTRREIESEFSMMVVGSGMWQHAVFDEGTFRRKCEGVGEVVSITSNAYSFQSAVLVRRAMAERRAGS